MREPTEEDMAELPNWAVDYIVWLEREKDELLNALRLERMYEEEEKL